jgi:NADP-dependent 3-hydroxy acid dehydrogenase YdfG
MPKGPTGQKRPGDVIGTAVKVAKIATGEVEEEIPKEHTRKGGLKGSKARAKSLAPEERSKIASLAANTRWRKTN